MIARNLRGSTSIGGYPGVGVVFVLRTVTRVQPGSAVKTVGMFYIYNCATYSAASAVFDLNYQYML